MLPSFLVRFFGIPGIAKAQTIQKMKGRIGETITEGSETVLREFPGKGIYFRRKN
jgi:hypothetical protein